MILNPKQQRIGFTADQHAFHKNIIKYSDRPFNNVAEMNEEIRDRHNSIFDKDDIIFNLGDALLVPRKQGSKETDPVYLAQAENWLKTFNGKIFYLPGNHESQLDLIRRYWKIVPQLYEVTVEDNDANKGRQSIVMCHYALRTWNKAHHGSWHIFGHSHGGLNGESMQNYPFTLSMDVGVDSNNFYPFLYEDVKAHMATKTFRASDHHSSKITGIGSVEDLSK